MAKSSGDADVDALVDQWLLWDRWESTKNEIQQLRKKDDVKELKKRLCSRMEFGTAGLRTRMGAGNSQMNDLTIIQTSQGLLRYMQSQFRADVLKRSGIVVGWDGRHNSERWAKRIAALFGQAEVNVHLLSKMTPTPFVPYGILKYKCVGGVMVTASHNPKEDNGYKVYWDNGSQIIPPHDSGIAASIRANLEPWEESWSLQLGSLVTDPYEDLMSTYFEEVKNALGSRTDEENAASKVRIVHSAMHGVGHPFTEHIFKYFNLPSYFPVVEQQEADPEFSTVKFPNPEEGKSALDLAIQTARRNSCTIILANDPDADRLAVAEMQGDGSWKVFSGNETAAIIGWWILKIWKKKHGDDLTDCYMISSTVSSFILKTMAEAEGFLFEDTLTGFKWMGNRSDQLMKQGKKVLFAFEEAIGFMCGTTVLDKDGVSACALFGELLAELAEENVTLTQKLSSLYDTYGFHRATTSYFICHEPPKIRAMFDRIRALGGGDDAGICGGSLGGVTYPDACGPYKIKNIRDLTTGYDDNQSDHKAVMPISKSTQMITFSFQNGCRVTIRTSGTEPKIKYYVEMIGGRGVGGEEIESVFQDVIRNIVQVWYQPDVNGFEWKKD